MGYSSKNLAGACGNSANRPVCGTSELRRAFLLFAGLQIIIASIALLAWRYFAWRDSESAARKEAEEAYYNASTGDGGRSGFVTASCNQCKERASHEIVDLEIERGELKGEWIGEAFYKCTSGRRSKLHAQKISFSYRHGKCGTHTQPMTFLRLIRWSPDKTSSYPSLLEPREVSHEEAVKRGLEPATGDCDGQMLPPNDAKNNLE